MLAADESRRALVDDVLDELSEQSLCAIRCKMLSTSGIRAEATPLGYVGALEATLAATARRLAAGDTIMAEREARELQKLLVEQLRHIVAVRWISDACLPLTRRDHDEWYTTGWAISLATPAPAGWVGDGMSWVLPGWTPSLRLDDLPRGQTPSSTVQPWGATRAVQTLARSAAIRSWLRAGKRQAAFEAHDLVGVLDDADLDLVLDDLRTASLEVAWRFAALAWKVNPARAFEEACATLAANLPSVEAWFHEAPREYLGRLADQLQPSEPRPAWVTTWALRRLLDAGPAADRLLVLARAGATGTQADAR